MCTHSTRTILAALTLITVGLFARPVLADDLRNVKHGEPMPACKLPALDGSVADSDAMKGSVIVYVCLSAEQHRSELAAIESQQVVKALAGEPVKLVHLTSDVVQRSWFEKLRQEHEMTATLALDADRSFYSKLGIIAFPTTIIVNKDGKLDDVIALHGSSYKDQLDAHIRHALGTLSDKDLQEKLAARPAESASPKSAATAHRALARLMRDRGQLDSAKTELTNGLALDGENTELLLDLADLETATGNLDSAETHVQKVLAANPDHRRAQQLRGVCLFRRGNLDDAQAVLEKSLPLNASPEVAHYYLGQIFEQKGQNDAAIEHYREALKRLLKDSDHPATPTAPATPASPSAPPATPK